MCKVIRGDWHRIIMTEIDKHRRVSKKGIFLTAVIVAGIILASFIVYFIQ
jgi:hypothetical protein